MSSGADAVPGQVAAREDYAKLHANTSGSHHQGQTSQEAQAALDEIDRLRAVIRTAAKDLYVAEVHRQSVGWDTYCTEMLVRAQHALAAETSRPT